MYLKITCAILIFIGLYGSVENASILALFSSLSYSDHLVYRGYLSLLAQRGHSIVTMTAYPGQYGYLDNERIVEIDVGQESSPYWDEYKKLLIDTDDYYPRMKAINELRLKIVVSQLKSKVMTALFLNGHLKFDLIITEAEIPILYAVAEKYKAPLIAITTTSGAIHQFEAKGAPVDPNVYPDVNTLYYRNITPWQKLVEIYRHMQTRNEYYNNYLPLCDIAAKKLFAIQPDLSTLEKNIDILFVAGNPMLIGNRPCGPSVAYVDRLHLQPGFQLPEDLKRILDSAPKDVIYFSFGAIQEPEHLSVKILQNLADAFKELPYLILWKISNTTQIKMPDNVITNAWFPQQDVLAHPKVKLFITHGGARSLEEAVFYETPIIGLPVLRSRKVFVQEITRHGAGEVIDLYYLEKEILKQVITRVISSASYKEAIVKLKYQIFDPMISGPEKAIMWTEYVLRNGGASVLRSSAAEYSILRYLSIDVLCLILLFLLSTVLFIYYTLRYIIRQIRSWIHTRYDLTGKFKAL